jgi:predicted ATP-grasp superfamily ATP-dependent carboligase
MMISEIIPGDDSQFFHYRSYIDGKDNVLAEICTQKLQQIPPGFGVARVSRTVPMIDALRVHTLDLLRSLHYRGVSSAEYKYDTRDEQYKLIEINSRPVIPELLFTEAGVNFSHISYLDLVEGVQRDVPAYDPEIYWIDQFGEFYEMVRTFAGGRPAFGNYFRPYRKHRMVFCVPFFKDPLPALVRAAELIRLLMRDLGRRLG